MLNGFGLMNMTKRWTVSRKQSHRFQFSSTLINDKERATLQCDSSELGIGVALMQGGQPVAYASRALTSTEQQYAQIEKELLTIVFGLERFDTYTFGRQVRIQTDHKPLEALLQKIATNVSTHAAL